MADAKKTEGEETAAPPKKKGKLLLFIIIGVVAVAVAVVAAVLLLKKKPVEEEEADGESPPKKEASHKTEAPKAPTYVKLDPFTSNLAIDEAAPAGPQYVQVVVELKVEDAHVAETIKPFTAEVRHEILRLLSGKKGAQLATMEGRDKLTEEIQLAVNMIINPPRKSKKGGKEEPPDGPVAKVLFSSFIIQ